MKDKELKLEDIEAPHTLGGVSYILFRHINLAEGGKSLAEIEGRKPRSLVPNVCVFIATPKLVYQSSRTARRLSQVAPMHIILAQL